MIKWQPLLMAISLLALIVGGGFFFSHQAHSETPASGTRGPYMLAAGDKMVVWRIDQATGKVSYCMRDTNSTDPRFILTRPPFCSGWSN